MEIKIVVKKSHIFTILGIAIIFSFVYAQSTPNPGHAITEVPGAARNCIANPSALCNAALATSGWNSWEVTSQAAMAYDSQKLGGIGNNGYCQANGSNCNFEGKGAIIGGGNSGAYSSTLSRCGSVCSAWGVGTTCSGPFGTYSGACGGIIQCPSGSTRREVSRSGYSFYICVKN